MEPINESLTTWAIVVWVLLAIAFLCFMILVVRVLLKYLKTKDIRKEKSDMKRSLGETLKQHRISSKMSQEFVAEAIGVSRQAVSKWETGVTDPSTSNLIALAKLFQISAEDLIKQTSSL